MDANNHNFIPVQEMGVNHTYQQAFYLAPLVCVGIADPDIGTINAPRPDQSAHGSHNADGRLDEVRTQKHMHARIAKREAVIPWTRWRRRGIGEGI